MTAIRFAFPAFLSLLALLLSLPSTAAPDLFGAIRSGDAAKVEQALNEGANVDAADSWGRTPLMLATQLRNTPAVKLVLARKPDVNAANRNDITPLIAATQSGNEEVVGLLLAAGADPDLADNLGWTALMWASARNRGAIAKRLVDAKADAHVEARDGATAIDLARKANADPTLIALLEACKPDAAKCATPKPGAAKAKAARPAPRTIAPIVDAQRIVRGNPDAPITIYEYTDFQCPYCAYGAKVMDEVMKRYEGRVKLVVKHLPLPKLHPMAIAAAEHFEAIALQAPAKAWAFYDRIFADIPALAGKEAYLRKVAGDVGADLARLEADLKGGMPAARVAADMKESAGFNFDGVPVFVVNGQVVEGAQPVEAFVEVIDGMR